jgi:hypothetical protein
VRAGDFERLLELLTDDTVQTMPPMLAWFQGPMRCAMPTPSPGSAPAPVFSRSRTLERNGHLAFATQFGPTAAGEFDALELTVASLTANSSRIRERAGFVRSGLLATFG